MGVAEDAWDAMRRLVTEGELGDRVGLLSRSTGLTPGLMRAVVRLRRAEAMTMRELARSLSCDPSYVTGLVDELARRHLAERTPHPVDRRVKLVTLTDAGRRVADDIVDQLAVPPRSLHALDRDELRALSALLAKAADADRSSHGPDAGAAEPPAAPAIPVGGRRIT